MAAPKGGSPALLARAQALLLGFADEAARLLLGLLMNLLNPLLPLLPRQRGVGAQRLDLRFCPFTDGASLLHGGLAQASLLQTLLRVRIATHPTTMRIGTHPNLPHQQGGQ